MDRKLNRMSSSYCPECGEKSTGGKFCGACGFNLTPAKGTYPETDEINPEISTQTNRNSGFSQYQNEQMSENSIENQNFNNQYLQNNSNNYQNRNTYTPDSNQLYPTNAFPGEYSRNYIPPPNYQETTSVTERIIGTLKGNIDVVEEIERRDDLQIEANQLLLYNFIALTVIKLLSIFMLTDTYVVENALGTIVIVGIEKIGFGYLYVYLIANIGKWVGGYRTQTDINEMKRVLAYAYVSFSVFDIIGLLSDLSDNALISLTYLIAFIWSFYVFTFAIMRALDRGWGLAILTVILAFVARIILFAIVDGIFARILISYYQPI